MATLLESLKLMELSLVDKGANQHARVSILKRDSSGKPEGEAEDLGKADTKENNSMSNVEKTVEGLSADLEKAVNSLAEVTAKLEKADALAKLSDAEKLFISKMSHDAADEFIGMTPAQRKKKMEQVNKSDETIEVAGETISKVAVGDAQFAVFKSLAKENEKSLAKVEAAEKRIEKAEAEAEMVILSKRASDEFSSLPGTPSEIAAVLKAIDAMDDEVQKTAEAILKSAEEANAQVFKKMGHSGGSVDSDLDTRVNKLADEIAKRDSISKSAAKAKVWEENPDLYNEYEAKA